MVRISNIIPAGNKANRLSSVNHTTKTINSKWIEILDQSGNANNRYKPSKQTRFKTSMLPSDLCHYLH